MAGVDASHRIVADLLRAQLRLALADLPREGGQYGLRGPRADVLLQPEERVADLLRAQLRLLPTNATPRALQRLWGSHPWVLAREMERRALPWLGGRAALTIMEGC